MSRVREVPVTPEHDGQRLDRWLKKAAPDIPYGLIQKLIRTGQIRVDGSRTKSDARLSEGQMVRLPPVTLQTGAKDKAKLSDKDAAFMQGLVIDDDGDMVVLNKPAGLASQGGTKTKKHVDGMLDALANQNGRPKLIHRLDRDTSGVLLLARKAQTVRDLGFAFKNRETEKTYVALVAGVPEIPAGTIDMKIAKSGGKDKEKMRPDPEAGDIAITQYAVADSLGGSVSLICFRPLTGRTHQIRVHSMEGLGCPIIGDIKYGYRPMEELAAFDMKDRLFLHAWRLSVPVGKKKRQWQAEIDPAFRAAMKQLGFDINSVKSAIDLLSGE